MPLEKIGKRTLYNDKMSFIKNYFMTLCHVKEELSQLKK